MSILQDENGRFLSTGNRWEGFMEGQEVMKKWLRHRPEGTQMWYGMKLLIFCEDPNITPKQFQDMDRLEARDIVWQYTQPFI